LGHVGVNWIISGQEMKIKIFVRTFTSVEDAEMFNSVLHTKWPMLLRGKKGARFRLVVDEDKPHVSTVVWEFENAKIQKDIEAIIAQEILRFSKALPNKEMHFQGEVELDFNEA
jgi:hypothetical protein